MGWIRWSIRVLVLSPILTVAAAVIFQSALGASIGGVLLAVPAIALGASQRTGLVRMARWCMYSIAGIGVGVVLLSLLLGIPSVTARAPAGAIGLISGPGAGLPPGFSIPNTVSTVVTGLNTRFDPVVRAEKMANRVQYRVDMECRGGEGGTDSTGTLDDGFGNCIVMSPVKPEGVRLADSLGGYAEVKWDGKQWALMACGYGGQVGTALGPTADGKRRLRIAENLLPVCLVAAMFMLALTICVQNSREPGSSAVVLSAVLLAIGLAGLMYSFINDLVHPFRGGEAAMAASLLLAPFVLLVFAGWVMLVVIASRSDLSGVSVSMESKPDPI